MNNSVTFDLNLVLSVPDVPANVPLQISVSIGQPMLTSEWNALQQRQELIRLEQKRQEQQRIDQQRRQIEIYRLEMNRYQAEAEAAAEQERIKNKHNWKAEGF